MQFISLLIALFLWQLSDKGRVLHQDAWFFAFKAKVAKALPETATATVAILVPSVLLAVIFYSLHYLFFGLFELLLAIAILLYSFGRGEFSSCLLDYADAWQNDKLHELPEIISKACPEYCFDERMDIYQLHAKAREEFVYSGFQRMFTVLFYFALFGPVAAFAYRLLWLSLRNMPEEENASAQNLNKALAFVEWLPARLLALSFALVGDFSKVTGYLSQVFFEAKVRSKTLLNCVAIEALSLSFSWQDSHWREQQSPEQLAQTAAFEMQQLQKLLSRSLALAVVGVAVFEMLR